MANLPSSNSNGGGLSGGSGGGGFAAVLLPVALCASVSMGLKKCHIIEGCGNTTKSESKYYERYKYPEPKNTDYMDWEKRNKEANEAGHKLLEEGLKETIKHIAEPEDTVIKR
jgi:hypothetical protein